MFPSFHGRDSLTLSEGIQLLVAMQIEIKLNFEPRFKSSRINKFMKNAVKVIPR